MSILGSLISSVFNIGSQAMTNKANAANVAATNAANVAMNKATNEANYRIMQETNAANRQLAEYEWSKNLEMWQRQNEYNTPSAQMQRLKEAGINPNLALGSVNSGNSASLPQYQSPSQQAATMQPSEVRSFQKSALRMNLAGSVIDMMNQYQDYRNKQIQGDLMRTEEQSKRLMNLINLDKNTRSWDLHKYDTQYRSKLVDKITNEVSMQAAESRYKELLANTAAWDYGYRTKYHTSPNNPIGAIASMANDGLLVPLLDWLFPRRNWMKQGIVFNQN